MLAVLVKQYVVIEVNDKSNGSAERQLTITIANRYYVILIAPTGGVQLHRTLFNAECNDYGLLLTTV